MGTEYVFVCEDCNEIYDLGKWNNARALVPYLRKKHKYCKCAACSEHDIEKNRYMEDEDVITGRIQMGDFDTAYYCSWSFRLTSPKRIPYRSADFWDEFRRWVNNSKQAFLRDTVIIFKMKFGLLRNPDWWEEDEKIDKEIEQSLSRINHFIDRVKTLNESTVDKIIDEVIAINN